MSRRYTKSVRIQTNTSNKLIDLTTPSQSPNNNNNNNNNNYLPPNNNNNNNNYLPPTPNYSSNIDNDTKTNNNNNNQNNNNNNNNNNNGESITPPLTPSTSWISTPKDKPKSPLLIPSTVYNPNYSSKKPIKSNNTSLKPLQYLNEKQILNQQKQLKQFIKKCENEIIRQECNKIKYQIQLDDLDQKLVKLRTNQKNDAILLKKKEEKEKEEK